jgi:hypothetical protein
MRNLSPNLSSPCAVVSDFHRGSDYASQSSVNFFMDVSHSAGNKKLTSYSQFNRQSRMHENLCSVRSFMDEQQRVIKDLIKQFQIYVGYREQIPESTSAKPSDSWAVYLMHVQSLQTAMIQVHQGKALFSNGAHPPLRVHLEHEGIVTPFDLPSPSLSGMISIQSFITGVLDHKLPSIDLANACMTDLLNALVEIQDARIRFCEINKKLSRNKTRMNSLTNTHLAKIGLPRPNPSVPTWYNKVGLEILSFLKPLLPSNSHA